MEKRERPKLTQDSAVGLSSSAEDGGGGGDEEEEQRMREKWGFLEDVKRVFLLGSHVVVLEFDERNKKCWFRAKAATAIEEVSHTSTHQFICPQRNTSQ